VLFAQPRGPGNGGGVAFNRMRQANFKPSGTMVRRAAMTGWDFVIRLLRCPSLIPAAFLLRATC
jgi:hypothetical protein